MRAVRAWGRAWSWFGINSDLLLPHPQATVTSCRSDAIRAHPFDAAARRKSHKNIFLMKKSFREECGIRFDFMSNSGDSIKVMLPDGTVKEFPSGVTPFQVAESISPRLAAAAVVARIKPTVNGTTGEAAPAESSMMRPRIFTPSGWSTWARRSTKMFPLQLLTEKDPDALPVVRHSAAHVLATAVLELFPETKLGHGPPTDSGFFYDFYRPTPFTPEDLKVIEGGWPRWSRAMRSSCASGSRASRGSRTSEPAMTS